WGRSIPSVAFAPDGTLYAIDNNRGIYTVNITTGGLTRIATASSVIYSIDFAPDGTLYASLTHSISVLNPLTAVIGAAVATTPTGILDGPIDYGPDGIIRVCSNANLLEIDPIAHTVSAPVPVDGFASVGIMTLPVPAPASACVLAALPVL